MEQEKSNSTQKMRYMWSQPWGYRESFLISFSLLGIGFILEILSGNFKISMPSWPLNLIILVVIIAYILTVQHYFKNAFLKWISSTYAAIAAISVFTILILMMGFTSQVPQRGLIEMFGLTHVISSWSYFLCSFFLMLVLGFSIAKRLNSFKLKNIAFLLNHLGLWIIIAAASVGSGDLKKYRMQLVKEQAVFMAVDDQGVQYRMPFALTLREFNIDEYNPNIGLVDLATNRLIIEKGDKLMEAKVGEEFTKNDWQFEVKIYLESALFQNGTYVESKTTGSAPAALIAAKNELNDSEISGWVSSGSFMNQSKILKLDEQNMLAMTIPRSKRFSSKIRVFKQIKEYEDIEVEVNKPIRILNWKIYQTGYNEKMGKWSNISIVELVKDPWLPVIYTGIFMVLFGSLYLVWMGRTKN